MRLSINDFRKGLWTIGGKESTMPSYLRRTRGMHAIHAPSLRSRNGSILLHTQADVHSIVIFEGLRYYIAGSTLYKDGVAVHTEANGLLRNTFLKLAPQQGQAPQLFFMGGAGTHKKIDSAGTIQNWGVNTIFPLATLTVSNNGVGGLAAGTYRYYVTFLNNTTGSRSNPVASGSISLGASRQISLSGIPTSSDTQVSAREIYRTVANGARYFRVGTILNNTTTTFNDNTLDINLQAFELQFDNVAPLFLVAGLDFYHAWVTNDRRVWWLDTDRNAYYSPPGRPESVRGFIPVASSDEFLTKGLNWNGANWIFSSQRLFRVLGDDEPFVALPIDGVPGTTLSDAITVTPYGIAFASYDGVYLFDGSRAQLLGYDEIAPLFRGESQENLDPVDLTSGYTLHYANHQLYLCSQINGLNTGQTLVYDFRSQAWRDLGLKLTALYNEPGTRTILAAFNGGVYALEYEGQKTDGTFPIAIEWEVGGALTDIAHFGTLQRAYFDINTTSQTLTVTAIIDGVSVALGTVNTAGRADVEVPFPSNWQTRVFSIRITGSVNERVELFGVAVDVKLEGANQALGIG